MKIRDILADDAVEMPLTQDENMIQAFASHTPNEPLADRISLGCLHRGHEHVNLPVLGHSGEASSILLVIVSDQKAWTLGIGRGFPDLLCDPNITW